MSEQNLSKQDLLSREQKLNEAVKALKEKFVGIDLIIDEIARQIKVWYLMPQLLTRPVIINLWGMTGVGKTDLIRTLVKKLDLQDKFAEIELSNGEKNSNSDWQTSVQEIIENYGLNSEEPCILFFDEIQKFRSLDEDNKEIQNASFQDFWELLSDGKLSVRDRSKEFTDMYLNLFFNKESARINPKTNDDDDDDDDEKMSSWQVRNLAKLMKKQYDPKFISSFIGTDKDKFSKILEERIKSKKIYEDEDYSKALIIISGNLDEAFLMAKEIDEAEVDADIFHSLTSKISNVEIKKALSKRFRPEQISRFGNIHLIYPSLRQKDFEEIILKKVNSICQKINVEYQIDVKIDQTVLHLIYRNGVFPVQGVRPVYSAVADILEANLAPILFRILTSADYTTTQPNLLKIKYNFDKSELQINLPDYFNDNQYSIKYIGSLDKTRQNQTPDFVALTSVHEAGHALIYALLFGLAPLQLKSRIASREISGFTFPHILEKTKDSIKQKIQVLLAGGIAEELLFGSQYQSTGQSNDLQVATSLAAEYIRSLDFGDSVSVVTSPYSDKAEALNTDIGKTNDFIENILQTEKENTRNLLIQHQIVLTEIAKELYILGSLSPQKFKDLLESNGLKCEIQNEEYEIIHGYSQKLLEL